MLLEKKMLEDDICLVNLLEEVEVYNSFELKDEMDKILLQGVNNIILDISKVEYIDSSGLGLLISILKKLKINNGHLILLSPKKAIKQILELTNLDRVFTIEEELDSAISIIKS